jgi:predicted 2-oxoglutarate/Fe(II)-dependent dioxygenase YbiX
MSSITTDLAAALSTVRRPGDFFVSGTTELLAPLLEVAGVGPIALPLLPVQAEQLVAVAERAPHGRGEETLVDTTVRRTWQIGADRVRIQGKHWARTLETIVVRAADGLGVSEPVTAELYKLLVYDQGSFFVSHRDTEKAPGMFATLVIVLPSISAGGDLVVRHRGGEVRIDLRCPEPSETAFAAFYADCVHEVLPVTEGCRLTLVYNLVRRGRGPLPEPPNYDGEQNRLASLLQAWGAGRKSPDDEAPQKLAYPLEHAYTPAELGFAALKGADAAVAGALAAAVRQSDTDLHLAFLTVEESGIADYMGGYGSRRGRWSEPELEAGEVDERSVTLSEWRPLNGNPSLLVELPVADDELSPPDALDDMDPDEEYFHEATGNEGASFERTYRRAAFVLWPRERFFAVLNQAGLSVTLPYLEDLTERWTACGEGRRSHLWDQAHDLSGHMVSKWPTDAWYPRHDKAPSNTARMLMLLTRLEDTARVDTLLAKIAAAGGHDKQDNTAIIGALATLSPAKRAAMIEQVIAGTATMSLGACGDLLGRAVTALTDRCKADLVPAAIRLVEELPGDPARAAVPDMWRRGPGVEPGFIVDLLTALRQIDEGLAGRAADHILVWPDTYGHDAILVPAVRRLIGITHSSAAVQRLRAVCLAHLRARIAQPLEPPKDWRRVNVLACSCRNCLELGHFLADPERRIWIYKAAEAERSHVEGTVTRARCDLDLTTDRRGRPYTLVCTKNQASYDRRAKQRAQDLENLARLDR